MPAKTFDKQLEKIDRDHGKTRELLERELEREREQAEAARAGGEEARSKEQRMTTAARETAARRFDVLATERRNCAVALDSTLDALTGQVDALLDLDRRQRDEEHQLGMASGGVAYSEQLETHLKIRLQRYIREAAMSVNSYLAPIDPYLDAVTS